MKTDYNQSRQEQPNVIKVSQYEKNKLHDKLVDKCDEHRGLIEIRDGYYLVDSGKFSIKQK